MSGASGTERSSLTTTTGSIGWNVERPYDLRNKIALFHFAWTVASKSQTADAALICPADKT
jgi:hypothetical protein